MYLGDSIEEKIESFEALNRGAKKLGMVFLILLGILPSIGMIALMFSVEADLLTRIFMVLYAPISIFIAYWTGKFWYYGFVTVLGWMSKMGLTGSVAATGVSSAITVAYLLSGRKGARATGIVLLVVLLIALSIGFYVGIFNYFKIRGQIKEVYAAQSA